MRPIFLVRTAHHNPERIIRELPLQRLGLIPWRAHPNVALFIGRENHRHRLRMDRFDDRVRRGLKEALDKMRAVSQGRRQGRDRPSLSALVHCLGHVEVMLKCGKRLAGPILQLWIVARF
jgi:hypothetical protein